MAAQTTDHYQIAHSTVTQLLSGQLPSWAERDGHRAVMALEMSDWTLAADKLDGILTASAADVKARQLDAATAAALQTALDATLALELCVDYSAPAVDAALKALDTTVDAAEEGKADGMATAAALQRSGFSVDAEAIKGMMSAARTAREKDWAVWTVAASTAYGLAFTAAFSG